MTMTHGFLLKVQCLDIILVIVLSEKCALEMVLYPRKVPNTRKEIKVILILTPTLVLVLVMHVIMLQQL